MYTIRLPTSKIRNDLKNHLLAKRIFSKVYFDPIHLTPFYRKKFNFKEGDLPVTEKISQQILTIPLFPNMTMEEKNYLVDSISEFFDDK
jgi:perosamine synthetase